MAHARCSIWVPTIPGVRVVALDLTLPSAHPIKAQATVTNEDGPITINVKG